MGYEDFKRELVPETEVFTPEYSPSNIPFADDYPQIDAHWSPVLEDEKELSSVNGSDINPHKDSLLKTYGFLLLTGQDLYNPQNVRAADIGTDHLGIEDGPSETVFYPAIESMGEQYAGDFLSENGEIESNPARNPAINYALNEKQYPLFSETPLVTSREIGKTAYMMIPDVEYSKYSFSQQNIESFQDGERPFDALSLPEQVYANADAVEQGAGLGWSLEKTVRSLLD